MKALPNYVSVIDQLHVFLFSLSHVTRWFKSALLPEDLDCTEKFLVKAKSVLLGMIGMTGTIEKSMLSKT